MTKRQLAEFKLTVWKALLLSAAVATVSAAAKAEYDLAYAALETDKDKAEVKALETAKAPEPKADANVVTMDELTAALTGAVEKSLKDKNVGGLTAEQLAQLTPEAIKGYVTAALRDQKAQDDIKAALTPERLATTLQGIVAKAIEGLKAPARIQLPTTDAARPGGQIEVPFGLRKGNLPLHMKQLCNTLLKKHQDDGIDAADLQKGAQLEDRFWLSLSTYGAKALTSTTAGTGDEWVPRSLSAELYRRLYLSSKLAQAFLAGEVDMPTDPYDYPLITVDPVFKLNTVENRDAEASDPTTAAFTLTTKKMMALVQYSYEANEDSIVPLLPTIQNSLGLAAARALETAIINGDTTGTHQDSDITDANDVAKAWKGFRKLALAVSQLKTDISSGGISRANLVAILKLLGKWGGRPSDLLWIIGPKAKTGLLGLDEFALAYARQGNQSTISGNPGEDAPPLFGSPTVVSEMARENLNASGVYDNSTTTKGAILAVYRPGFVMGSRRAFTIETARNIRSQTNDIVASFRKAFQPVETPANTTAQTVAIGYNYTS